MWCTCFFESKVGTLADQLNVICFSNISIISDSYLSNKFGIMSGTLFSLMDSGAVLSRYDDGTEYKGMSACKSRDFCHLGQSTISGGWMKILRLLTLLLPRLWFFPYRTPHGPPAEPPAPTACVPPPPPPPTPPHPRRVFFVRRGPTTAPHNHRPHPSPFLRTGELRRALKNRLTQFWNLVYCHLTSVEYKRGKP
jgi:hypothetical protein